MDQIKVGDPATDMLAAYRSDSNFLAQMYEPTLRHAGALAEFARQNGKPFILIHLPMAFQVDANAWDQGRKAYRLENRIYESGEGNIVKDFCQTQKLTCLFADGAIKTASQNEPSKKLFFRYDFHLTPEGNRIVGEWLGKELASFIEKEKLFLGRHSTFGQWPTAVAVADPHQLTWDRETPGVTTTAYSTTPNPPRGGQISPRHPRPQHVNYRVHNPSIVGASALSNLRHQRLQKSPFLIAQIKSHDPPPRTVIHDH
jgi:hypothetical protein